MKKFICILSLLAAASAFGDTVAKYGVELPKGQEGLGTTKAIFIAEQDKWFGPFIRQYEFGGWADNAGNGRRSSLLGSIGAGVNVNAGYVFVQALVGPALISSPDSLLGGSFQFDNDFAIGLKDPQNGNTIGFNYKHVSSAGIESPNAGRDFLMFRVSIPW